MTGIQKISTIILYIIAGLSVLFAGLYFLGGTVPDTVGTSYEEKNFTSVILIWSVILFIIAGVATLIFSFANIFTNPKVLKSFFVVLALAVVLGVISYFLASSEPIANWDFAPKPTPGILRWVGTGLNATYILAIIAFLGIIASEVWRAFK